MTHSTTIINAPTAYASGAGVLTALPADHAVVAGVTRALIDYSNPASSPVAAGELAVANGVNMTDLAVGSAFKAGGITNGLSFLVAGGCAATNGVSTGLPTIDPSTYKPPVGAQAIGVGLWCKLAASGLPYTALTYAPLLAVSSTSPAGGTTQYALMVSYDGTGALAGLHAGVGNGTSPLNWAFSDPALLAILSNGSLHHIYFYIARNTDGTVTRRLYIDGAVYAEQSRVTLDWTGVVTSAFSPVFGGGSSFFANTTAKALAQRFGRPRLDVYDGTSWTPAEIVAMEMQSAAGYLSAT